MNLKKYIKLSLLTLLLVAFVQSTTANIGNARNNPSIWDIILLPFSQLDNQKQESSTKRPLEPETTTILESTTLKEETPSKKKIVVDPTLLRGCKEEGYFPLPGADCRRFLWCKPQESGQYQGFWFRCPEGYRFRPDTNEFAKFGSRCLPKHMVPICNTNYSFDLLDL